MTTIEINSTKLVFDKEKTHKYQIKNCHPCDCQGCENYYKNIEQNHKLIEFLSVFGIDCFLPEEVVCFSLNNKRNSLIHYEANYGVDGQMDIDEFGFDDFDVKLTFKKGVNLSQEKTDNYFWIVIEKDFPYILKDKRDI